MAGKKHKLQNYIRFLLIQFYQHKPVRGVFNNFWRVLEHYKQLIIPILTNILGKPCHSNRQILLMRVRRDQQVSISKKCAKFNKENAEHKTKMWVLWLNQAFIKWWITIAITRNETISTSTCTVIVNSINLPHYSTNPLSYSDGQVLI